MRGVSRVLALATFAQVGFACFTIDVAGTSEDLRTDCLRDEGDFFHPARRGCNLTPCGAQLNREIAPRRFRVSKDEEFFVKLKLTDVHRGGQLIYDLKYGNAPDFQMTPGFEQEAAMRQNVVPNTDIFDWVKAFKIDPAYIGNATLQVRYETDGLIKPNVPGVLRVIADEITSATFYQCIDITVTDGQPFPAGIGDNGFGPNYIITAPDEGIPFAPGGLKPFWIGFIILALLILLCGLGVAYLFLTQKEPERPAFQPRVHEATVAPPKEPTPRRKTPTPSQQSSQSDEAVAVMHYTDAQEAEKEKSQSATPPVNDATGSQGRHFHFRYINEGEDEK